MTAVALELVKQIKADMDSNKRCMVWQPALEILII